MSEDAAEIKRHVRGYLGVFFALACLTVVTVTVSYLDLTTGAAITVALIIATIKSSLVAAYFMHLINEKRLIYYVLILTVFFFAVLMITPYVSISDLLLSHK